MKILIIGDNIYPIKSPRSFRATELAKEFSRLGHKVTLYGNSGAFDYSDFSKETGVIVKSIPLKCVFSKADGYYRYNKLDFILNHLFHYLLEYPDIEYVKRVEWILKNEPDTDYLITIAFPYPIHWGAALAKVKLKEKFPSFWASDCGDPYCGNPIHKHPFYFRWVEKFWCKQTDAIVVPIENAIPAYRYASKDRKKVIPQGFDMSGITIKEGNTGNKCPHFAYTGIVYPGVRDPKTFLDYLCTIQEDFVFTIYTKSPASFEKHKQLLGDKLVLHSYVPRKQLVYELSCQDFLINLTNPSTVQSPSKLVDYVQSGRPILDISTPFNEQTDFCNALIGVYRPNSFRINVEDYNIKNVANKFLELYYNRK